MDKNPLCLVINNRIGNILFQVATAATLAKNNNNTFFYTPDSNITRSYVQGLRDNILRKIEYRDSQPFGYSKYDDNTSIFRYQEIPYQENLMIFGLFQSEKYFDRELVLDLFSPTEEMLNEIKNLYPILFEKKCVSLNVRRGDYIGRENDFNVCSGEYYKEIINEFGSEFTFVVTSDDINWCKSVFQGDNFIFIDKPCNNKIVTDLYIQTLCEHNIMSCSTFSWWGAYLNKNENKKVIVPDPWFGKGLSWLDTSDLIPETWIKRPIKTV